MDHSAQSATSAQTVAALPIRHDGKASMGGILMDFGRLAASDIDRVLELQRSHGMLFGEAARLLGLVGEDDVQRALARQFGYQYAGPGEGAFAKELVAAYQPFGEQAEMLRGVRTQLMQRWFDRGRKMLAVASIGEGEGASLFAANLAVVFSQLGERTLLIDANLRRPRQHEIFNLSSRQGLADILANRAGIETFSKVESFTHLSVLPAGTRPPNPQELISRNAFSEASVSLADRFDIILMDVPAFSAGADALAIAGRVGGVLLVCRKDVTRTAQLQAVCAQVERAGADVVASVLVDF
jgi:protein-tyrosine kinase